LGIGVDGSSSSLTPTPGLGTNGLGAGGSDLGAGVPQKAAGLTGDAGVGYQGVHGRHWALKVLVAMALANRTGKNRIIWNPFA
jgi:hypothetical protein